VSVMGLDLTRDGGSNVHALSTTHGAHPLEVGTGQ
jgi:hypothetical protein